MSRFIHCYAELRYAESRYAVCCYAECHYAESRGAQKGLYKPVLSKNILSSKVGIRTTYRRLNNDKLSKRRAIEIRYVYDDRKFA